MIERLYLIFEILRAAKRNLHPPTYSGYGEEQKHGSSSPQVKSLALVKGLMRDYHDFMRPQACLVLIRKACNVAKILKVEKSLQSLMSFSCLQLALVWSRMLLLTVSETLASPGCRVSHPEAPYHSISDREIRRFPD